MPQRSNSFGRLHWPAEKELKVLFMGTPEFSVPCLERLLSETRVCGVVTQPGRPSGRGLKPAISPVARLAAEAGLPVLSPSKIRQPEVIGSLRGLSPDLIVVAAYGKILPPSILEIPPLGCINVHASLLPKHRGAAPIAAAILAGDEVTGITIMEMNERMDAGDILLKREIPIVRRETSGSLHEKLKLLGGEALAEALVRLRGPGIERVPQDEAQATFAPMIKKEDGQIKWSQPAEQIERCLRAYFPWPSAFTTVAGRHLKLLEASVSAQATQRSSPGTLITVEPAGISVATGSGILVITRLQLEGRRALEAAEFVKGAKLRPGMRLGE